MKKLAAIVFLVVATATSFAQSRSFEALQAKFHGKKDVFSLSMNGMFCRLILKVTTSKNDILREMTKNVRHVRLIAIPKEEFERQQASLSSFRSYLKKDQFEELMMVKDNTDHVFLYRREDDKKNPRYFLLVEEPTEIVAVEMRGDIDPALFKNGDNRLTTTNR